MDVETFDGGWIYSIIAIGCCVALWFLLRYVGGEIAMEIAKGAS